MREHLPLLLEAAAGVERALQSRERSGHLEPVARRPRFPK
jgi:hypothetical protein